MSKNKKGNKTRTEKRFLASLVMMSALIGLIIIISGSAAMAQTSSTAMTKYTDPQGRFSISYPVNWTAEPATNRFQTVAVVFNSNVGASLNMIVRDLTLGTDPATYANNLITYLPFGYSLFQNTECTKYTIEGHKACDIVVTKDIDASTGTTVPFVEMQLTSYVNGKMYAFTMGASQDTFDSLLPTFEAMLNSFKTSGTGDGSTNPNILQ